MLIKALNEYYDILSEAGKVCPDGFSKQKVHYMIMLRKDGTISGIVDVTESDLEGKKKNIPLLSEYARLLRVEERLRAYLEVLL